ncbi:aminotransferase class IV family protein [Caviibacterium pharyngocola]|uniref:Branched-chain amino acid aminotransferase n=1 Tax=Caviibacterium pharyngocola TaxID=28159 RepID=A0A2M8RYB6_9PAST|nr:aminotransferase class IV family protein [Caviibacterium pharyngocola]PJG83885.1 hypothetical protein CVP04_01995 [Caviibacterium pharyngocola]
MNYPLFETLCIERGVLHNAPFHQARYAQSLRRFYGKSAVIIHDLSEIIKNHTALFQSIETPIIRCRIDYNRSNYQINCFPYERKNYLKFQPVICNDIDYGLKYANRDMLNRLLAQKDDCDEIMIIKQGKVTDCSIGNLVFRQGSQWFTPDSPLLAGTQRAKLLAEKRIKERSIYAENLAEFDEIRLINALNPLQI